MSSRLPNPRLAKIHRTYRVDQVANLYHKHRSTIRNWIKLGLPTCGVGKPFLIHGHDLRVFLEAKRRKNKRPCKPGEFYCVRCRAPKLPAGATAEYQPRSATSGTLVGTCPDCRIRVHRYVSLAKLYQVRGGLDVTLPSPQSRISDTARPFLNYHLKQESHP